MYFLDEIPHIRLNHHTVLLYCMQWNIEAHVRSQAEKEKPQRAFINQILTVLREEVKEFNRTAKSGQQNTDICPLSLESVDAISFLNFFH